MQLESGALRVFYRGKSNVGLDRAIRKCLKEFGYKNWASSYCRPDDVRELAFDQKGA